MYLGNVIGKDCGALEDIGDKIKYHKQWIFKCLIFYIFYYHPFAKNGFEFKLQHLKVTVIYQISKCRIQKPSS